MPYLSENHTIDTVNTQHADWRDDLFRDGYVVVKNLLSEERAQGYIDAMFDWLEKFPWRFDRDNRETWTEEHLPAHIKGGMYHGYSVQHEKFMWEARQEPSVIECFSRLWGTDNLLVSFDGMNISLPSKTRTATQPWPHIDQSPERKGMQCVQGIINFAPNGPEDGGLVVLKGSHLLNEEFFAKNKDVLGRKTWGPTDWFGFNKEEVAWFESKGCETIKVCAGPGDLILWDSRTMHYNRTPDEGRFRAIIYACYTPASFAAPHDLAKKAKLFDARQGTTHWPHSNIFEGSTKQLRLGQPDPHEDLGPFTELHETDRILRLSGKLPY